MEIFKKWFRHGEKNAGPINSVENEGLHRRLSLIEQAELLNRKHNPAASSGMDYRQFKGINTLVELCTRLDILDDEVWIERIVSELTADGINGTNALANLINEILQCRSTALLYAAAVASKLEPTAELEAALHAVATADNITSPPDILRFSPEISGGGQIGWTDGTGDRMRRNALKVLEILDSKK
jgi:hypothetical protein